MTTTTTTTTTPTCPTPIQSVVRSSCTSLLSMFLFFVVAIENWERTPRLKNGRGFLGGNYS